MPGINNNNHKSSLQNEVDLNTGAVPNRMSWQRYSFDVLIFVVVFVPVIVFQFSFEPFRRGFFCNDESIVYPFSGNTISHLTLGLLVGLLPLIIIVLVEFVRFLRHEKMVESTLPVWLAESVCQMFYYGFGVCITFDLTQMGKYTIGRLRPHFMVVCQPRMDDGSTCADAINQYRYVQNYKCVANGYTEDDVLSSRLSFPSDHSSLIFFAMLYTCFYLHKKFSWRGSKLARHFVQLCLITVAWFTALSRIMDYWHHWSDVLFGSLIGITMAILMAKYVTKLFVPSSSVGISRTLHIPRQDTTATLQEVFDANTTPSCSKNSNFKEALS